VWFKTALARICAWSMRRSNPGTSSLWTLKPSKGTRQAASFTAKGKLCATVPKKVSSGTSSFLSKAWGA
jgi:hypothetical protein